MNIIEIEDLTYTYPGAETPILDHVNLQVEKGDFLAIVGNNGCGKSTMAKLFNGMLLPTAGKVLVDGIDTAVEETQLEVRRRVDARTLAPRRAERLALARRLGAALVGVTHGQSHPGRPRWEGRRTYPPGRHCAR